jgi:menaquinol-cytochrome c reductase iron-sulfur subunit
LDYDRGSACFFCPCHGGIFRQNGERLAGPPKRPMYRYAHRLRDGIVEIDLQSVPAGI